MNTQGFRQEFQQSERLVPLLRHTWHSEGSPLGLLVNLAAQLGGQCEWSSGCSVHVVLSYHKDGEKHAFLYTLRNFLGS